MTRFYNGLLVCLIVTVVASDVKSASILAEASWGTNLPYLFNQPHRLFRDEVQSTDGIIPLSEKTPYPGFPYRGTAGVRISRSGIDAAPTGIGVRAEQTITRYGGTASFDAATNASGEINDTIRFDSLPENITHVNFTAELSAELSIFQFPTYTDVGSRVGASIQASYLDELENEYGDFEMTRITIDRTALIDTYRFNRGTFSTDGIETTGFDIAPFLSDNNDDGIAETADQGVFTLRVPINDAIRASREFDIRFTMVAMTSVFDSEFTARLPANQSFSSRASSFNSMHFTSMTFGLNDGTEVTPELLGVGITFDSGMTSPNVAVPEPGTLLFAGLGVAYWTMIPFRKKSRSCC